MSPQDRVLPVSPTPSRSGPATGVARQDPSLGLGTQSDVSPTLQTRGGVIHEDSQTTLVRPVPVVSVVRCGPRPARFLPHSRPKTRPKVKVGSRTCPAPSTLATEDSTQDPRSRWGRHTRVGGVAGETRYRGRSSPQRTTRLYDPRPYQTRTDVRLFPVLPTAGPRRALLRGPPLPSELLPPE